MIQKLEPRHFGPDSGFGGATFSDVIDKVNEIIDAMNGEHDPADIYSEDGRLIAKSNESEDERIRTFLLDHAIEMIACLESDISLSTYDGIKGHDPDAEAELTQWQKARAYLEKQKEDKDELVYRLNGLMQDYIKEGKDDEEKEHRLKCYQLFWDALEDTNFFEQKEQKPELVQHPPITYTYPSDASRDEQLKLALIALLNNDLIQVRGRKFTKQDLIDWVEQKPTWSEEDETRLTNILIMLKEYAIHHYSKDDVSKSVDWLENRFKSLRPQPREEIYHAAKHDLAIKFMNYLDENRPEGKMSLSNGECEDIDKAFKENDWAKIMRYVEKYRPHFKPSEEQMEALNAMNCCGELSYQGQQQLLIDLYQQLKKLM